MTTGIRIRSKGQVAKAARSKHKILKRTLTLNQARFLGSDLAAAFFGGIKEPAATAGLLSDEHFTVVHTRIQ